MEKVKCLVMPSQYVELDAEEMSYVDGGGVLYTWMVSTPIDIACMACGATMIFGGIKLLGKFFGKSLAKNLSKIMAPVISGIVGAICGAAFNVGVGQLGSALFQYAWSFTSLGGLISFVLDIAIDGNVNGIICSW